MDRPFNLNTIDVALVQLVILNYILIQRKSESELPNKNKSWSTKFMKGYPYEEPI